MEEEVRQLRCSRSLAAGDFCLSDAFYFYQKGVESIVDDQVTQRFSSEELASWNLLTRTNHNFHYISLRLTFIWGLGVFVRYCVLFPLRCVGPAQTAEADVSMCGASRSALCRITLAVIGLSWLVMGTTVVGCLPESR